MKQNNSKDKNLSIKMSTTTGSPKLSKPKMNQLTTFNFFPFQWQYEDETFQEDDHEEIQTVIRIYGWNEKNESVYVRVEDFPIPMWVELPDNIEWTESAFQTLYNYMMTLQKENKYKPKNILFQYKRPLYFASIVKDHKTNTYANKEYPYLQITFRNMVALERFSYKLKNEVNIPRLGDHILFKCHCHEKSTTPIIKLLAFKQLPSANWIEAKGLSMSDYRETSKTHEYLCSFKNLKAHPNLESMPIVYPKVLSFDNEAYSSNSGSMPRSDLPQDKVFMIGCTISSMIERKKQVNKYLLVIGPCDPIEGVEVISYNNELALYLGFSRFIQQHDPDVIIGYNIFGWDIKFMAERADKMLNCSTDFARMGTIQYKVCPIKNECWESSAYGKQDLTYIECDGRLFVDMLPYIQRNFKLSNYRLETVCSEFLKDNNKDPLKAKEMFRLYESKDPANMKIIGAYCAQDAYVTYLLFEKLLTWFDLTETATTNGVPIFYLYTKGQQVKMYAQILKYCVKNNITVQSNAYKVGDDEHFVGASVTQPRAGLYKSILPFDFASLYPSIIMAYNIDMSRLVDDRNGINTSIPDELCNVITWEDHIYCSCPKDPKRDCKKAPPKDKDGKVKRICAAYRYRFLKAEVTGKGVIPTLLENLIKARKDTRKLIAKNEEEIERLRKEGGEDNLSRADELESINLVLDKRQLSYKVSANSMYGAMGVKQGKLPFLPGAMCTTYIGRVSIKKASEFLEQECGGQVIYNDTDSAYTYFPSLRGKSSEEIWQFAEQVVKRVAKLFPAPMKLEFEDKVYHKFLILTKKRYVAQPISRDGVIEDKLFKRGVVLQRRDNCPLLRELYQKIVWYVLDNIDELTQVSREAERKEILSQPVVANLLTMITDGITDALFEFKHSYKNFVITKALKREEYKSKTVPSHVFVAQKMRNRGVFVPQNSRIEYVMLDTGNGYQKKELQNAKVEDVNFYVDNKEQLRLDYLYYLEKQFMKPLNEMLKVVVHIPKLMPEHLKDRILKSQMLTQFRSLFKPKITFYDDIEPVWGKMSLHDYLYKYDGVPYEYRDFFNQDDVKEEIDYLSFFLEQEVKENKTIYPPLNRVFRAFHHYHHDGSQRPKVIILGQDPYHDGAACGLAFSVETSKINPSLQNIMKEIEQCGFDADPEKGDLNLWARQGVMLLNTSLTVEKGEPSSHIGKWKEFTTKFLEYVNCPVGLLWGAHAISYKPYFEEAICTSHPSPYSAHNKCGSWPAFKGSKCFQKVNSILQKKGTRVYWNMVEKVYDLPKEEETKPQKKPSPSK